MNTYPIWQDLVLTCPSSASYKFRLKDTGGNVIYTGKAVCTPDAAATTIKVNDICADYMAAHSLPDFTSDFTPQMLEEIFSLELEIMGVWQTLSTWVFLANWSYVYDYDVEDDGLEFPISRIIPRYGHFFLPLYTQENSITMTLHFADGSTLNKVITIHCTADYNADYNEDFSIEDDGGQGYGVAVLPLVNYAGDIVSVSCAEYGEWIVEDCRRYALHYVNAYGGWDTFTPARFELMQDTYTRHEMKVAYDNDAPENRGIVNYANEVARGITFRTGVLDDIGGGRMHHLLGSTCVYLEDCSTGIFYPVNIKDTTADYKTFRNQGGKRVEYTFGVKLAHEMIRR